MSKELEAFKGLLKQLFPNYDVDVSFDDICNLNGNLNIIRNELKENQERIEELEETNHLMFIREHKNAKKVKAFDIIKEKGVNVNVFLYRIKKDTDYKEYKRLCGLYKIMAFSEKDLTEDDFDLLKEVLL